MDRALRPVIAKGRVQFSAKPETFQVLFSTPVHSTAMIMFTFIYIKVLFKEIQIDSIIKK